MAVAARVEVGPTRCPGAVVFANGRKTEPIRVTVALPTPSMEKLEVWSGDGPGHRGSSRLLGLPTERTPDRAMFLLTLGAPVPPSRLTVVGPGGPIPAPFFTLRGRDYESRLATAVRRAHPGFSVSGSVVWDARRRLQLTIEEHNTLVTDVMRVPVRAVHLPVPPAGHGLAWSLAMATPCTGSDTRTAVHVWETRVARRDTLTSPNLLLNYRELLEPATHQVIRISRDSTPSHSRPGAIPVAASLRLAVLATHPEQAAPLMTRELLKTVDHLLAMLGTRRVVFDERGIRTGLSCQAFTDQTAPQWMERVLAVSRAYERARSRLTRSLNRAPLAAGPG